MLGCGAWRSEVEIGSLDHPSQSAESVTGISRSLVVRPAGRGFKIYKFIDGKFGASVDGSNQGETGLVIGSILKPRKARA
jgi:hypothetical protein